MFKVYCDDTCIYDDTQTSEQLIILEPKLNIEDNSAGSFTAKIPTQNIGYDSIKRLKSEIVVLKENVEYWRGRVISENVDFWNNRSITCEGELSYLNDTIQIPKDFESGTTISEFLGYILDKHNEHSDWNKKFYLGNITVQDSEYEVTFKTNYDTTLNVIFNTLIPNFGGHLRIRKANGLRYLDYLSESYFRDCEQSIEFGKNILDFTRNYDFSEFATVLIPLGAMMVKEEEEEESESESESESSGGIIGEIIGTITGSDTDISDITESTQTTEIDTIESEYLTVASVNGGSIYVESSEAITNFGRIERKVEFNEVEDATTLLLLAQLYLVDAQFDQMELEVSAIDLSCIMDIDDVRLMDRIHVTSQPHGLDRYFPVRRLEICLDQPENSTFVLGAKTTSTLTNVTVKKTNDIQQDVEQVKTEYTSKTEVKASLNVMDTRIVAEVKSWTNDELEKYATLEITEEGLNSKVGKGETVSEVNQSAEGLDITGNRLTIKSDNFELDADGTMRCKNAEIEGEVIADSFLSELDMRGYPVQIRMQAGTYPLVISSAHSTSLSSPNEFEVQGFGHEASISVNMEESRVQADSGYFDSINGLPVDQLLGGGLKANSFWNTAMTTYNDSATSDLLVFWSTISRNTNLTLIGNLQMVVVPTSGSTTSPITIRYKVDGIAKRTMSISAISGTNDIPLFAIIPEVNPGSYVIAIEISGTYDRIILTPKGLQLTLFGYGLIDSEIKRNFQIKADYSDYVYKDSNGNFVTNTEYESNGITTTIDKGYLERLLIDTSDKEEIESVVITNA